MCSDDTRCKPRVYLDIDLRDAGSFTNQCFVIKVKVGLPLKNIVIAWRVENQYFTLTIENIGCIV